MRAASRWYAARCVGRGQAALTAVASDVEMQAVWGHPQAGVGVLLSLCGVDEPQTGSHLPLVWNRWTRASRHLRRSVGPCSQRQ